MVHYYWYLWPFNLEHPSHSAVMLDVCHCSHPVLPQWALPLPLALLVYLPFCLLGFLIPKFQSHTFPSYEVIGEHGRYKWVTCPMAVTVCEDGERESECEGK